VSSLAPFAGSGEGFRTVCLAKLEGRVRFSLHTTAYDVLAESQKSVCSRKLRRIEVFNINASQNRSKSTFFKNHRLSNTGILFPNSRTFQYHPPPPPKPSRGQSDLSIHSQYGTIMTPPSTLRVSSSSLDSHIWNSRPRKKTIASSCA